MGLTPYLMRFRLAKPFFHTPSPHGSLRLAAPSAPSSASFAIGETYSSARNQSHGYRDNICFSFSLLIRYSHLFTHHVRPLSDTGRTLSMEPLQSAQSVAYLPRVKLRSRADDDSLEARKKSRRRRAWEDGARRLSAPSFHISFPWQRVKSRSLVRLRTHNPSVTVNRDSSLYTREPFI